MSDADGPCEYVLDPDDPETWGGKEGDECYVDEDVLNKDGVWTCPHDSQEGEDLCIFHLPVDEKEDEHVVEAFLDALDEAAESDDPEVRNRKLQFLNTRFGKFDLSENPPDIALDDGRLTMSYAEIAGEVDWSSAVLDIPFISLQSVEFGGVADFGPVKFGGVTDFSRAEFGGVASFLGAEFGDEAVFTFSAFNQKVSMNAEFGGEADFLGVEFSERANFTTAIFKERASFRGVEFGKRASFRKADFGGDTEFRDAEFKREAVFSVSEFGGEANFLDVEFGGDAEFSGTEFGGQAHFLGVEFRRDTEFRAAEFGGETVFRYAEFGEEADFKDGEFGEEADFLGAEFGGESDFRDADFGGEVSFSNADFGGETAFSNVGFGGRTDFRGSEFREDAYFRDAEFKGATYFVVSEFNKRADFAGLSLDKSRFDGADLTDATFPDTNLCDASLENALLSRATLFGTDLRGARISGAVLGDIRIDDDTQFLGHPSDDSDASPHTFSAIGSRPCCVYDPDYEDENEHEDVDKAKSVYRALEELGGKHARPRLQARSFVRRQDLQKKDYWDDATADDASLEERFIAGARWSRARVARATLLYGESPWRVIAWSLGIIVSFALLYPLGGWMKPADGDPITYAQIASNPVEILNSVYYSTLTYTALGFGDFQPVGFGRLLTTVETGLGAVMLALLVFILGRRAAR